MRTLSIVVLLVLMPVSVFAQQSDAQRTNEIVASFNKEKHLVKEKNGVRYEKYKKVVSEPAIKQNVSDYSGVYEVEEFGFLLNLQVANDGTVKATGYEPGKNGTRSFRLERAAIKGAMLTATKVYDDGAKEKFEGVFLNRTDYLSPTDRGVRMFGLGVVGNQIEVAGVTLDRLFYQLKH